MTGKKTSLPALFLAAVILLSPLLFGSVYSWAFMGISCLLFILILLAPDMLLASKYFSRFFIAGLCLVWAWSLMQVFTVSANGYETLQQSLFWMAAGIAMVACQQFSRTTNIRLLGAIAFIGFFEAGYALYEIISGRDAVLWAVKKSHWGYATGTYFNRNNLAGLLELSLGVSAGFLLQAIRMRRIGLLILSFVSAATIMASLARTGSRMSLVALGVAFLLLVPVLFRRDSLAAWSFFALFAVCAGGLLWWSRELLFLRFDSLADGWGTWEGRLLAWPGILKLISEHLWTGVGLGNFAWIFPAYQPAALVWEWDHAHNDYLELAAELGLPAAIVIFCSFAWILLHGWFRMMKSESSFFPYIWGAWLGIFAFLIHGLTDFNLSIPANALLMLIALSAGFRLARPREKKAEIAATHIIRSERPPVWRHAVRWGVRLTAVGGILLTGQMAWSGGLHYQARQALEQEQYGKALKKFEKIPDIFLEDAGRHYDFGLAAWHQGRQEDNPAWYKLATHHFRETREAVPSYGKAWLYEAISAAALEKSQRGKISAQGWQQFRDQLEKAYALEGGNAWVSFMTGIHLISHDTHLDEPTAKAALDRIRRGIALSPSGYLEPALDFLWKKNQDWERMIAIVPETYDAYQVFIRFLAERGLWKKMAEIYPAYFELQKKEYERRVDRGLIFLEKSDFARALEAFREAHWIMETGVRAQAGMIAAAEALDKLPADYRETLKKILEQEDESLGYLLDRLGPTVRLTRDPYLMGIYAYRKENFAEALTLLEQAAETGKTHRRYLADLVSRQGDKGRAVQLLMPALGEKDPDLRDLLLLAEWDTRFTEQVQAKIESAGTARKPARAWFADGMEPGKLDRHARQGMVLNLLPGRRLIEVQVKGIPNEAEEQGVLIFRLQGQVIGTVYVNDSEWYPVLFPVDVTGGRRWFEAELLNGMQTKDGRSGTLVFLGDVVVQ